MESSMTTTRRTYLLTFALFIVSPVTGQVSMPAAFPSFVVKLPEKLRALPEPLPHGQKEPGFTLRGIKGWMWKPEQYLAEIPVLAEYKMNFMMNCYASMCDIENQRWGEAECNRGGNLCRTPRRKTTKRSSGAVRNMESSSASA